MSSFMTKNLHKRFHYCLLTPIAWNTEGSAVHPLCPIKKTSVFFVDSLFLVIFVAYYDHLRTQ